MAAESLKRGTARIYSHPVMPQMAHDLLARAMNGEFESMILCFGKGETYQIAHAGVKNRPELIGYLTEMIDELMHGR